MKKSDLSAKKPEYYIRPIPLVKGRTDMSLFTYRMNFGKTVEFATYAWYLEGSNHKILVDTGGTVETYRKKFGPELYAEPIQSIEDGLRKFDLSPQDIDIVLLTHLHWDHVELGFKFNKAKFFVQKAELDFAYNPHPIASKAFVKETFKDLKFEVVEGDREIIEGIRVFLTPGHSPGGQAVAVNTGKGVTILPGFCTVLDNFYVPEVVRNQGHQVITPGMHLNAPQAYDSALKVKQMADLIIPLHDSSFVDKEIIP